MGAYNLTYIGRDSSTEEQSSNAVNLAISLFFFITSFFGIMGNSIFIWTLGFRMKKTVIIIWFFSLVLSGLIFSMIMPLLGVFILLDGHWPFGTALCKLVNMLISLCMYSSVFTLTIISLDRCLLVIYPVWTRRSRSLRCAMIIRATVWITALMFSAPYLAFREVGLDEKNKTVCYNNYLLSDDWKDPEVQSRREQIQLCFFIFRLLFGFLVPFAVITSCYISTAAKVKMRKIMTSSKFIKVIIVSVVSFFACWTPYHLFQGILLFKDSVSELLIQAAMLMATIFACINVCFTPIFYLFIGENFKAFFKKSLLSLIESAFHEELD